jgi:hypothetical protein
MDEDEIRWFRRHQAREQRRLDEQVADMRSFYASLPPEEKVGLREWLKRLIALWDEFPYEAGLRLRIENDVYDKDGNVLRWGDFEFSPFTILRAIEAWDKGDGFTPQTGGFPPKQHCPAHEARRTARRPGTLVAQSRGPEPLAPAPCAAGLLPSRMI